MIGEVLDGRYRVLAPIGEGAIGQVYLAEHVHLGRREAIKVLRPGIAKDASFASRFRREARATNRLQHPNIVSVYDFGQLPDGRMYLAMEYADGRPLDRVLAEEGPLEPARVLRIGAQLALAIDHAHARGVIHRDLKPSNLVLVEHRGHADVLKALDFGMAKIIGPDYDESRALTREGEIFGTAAYLAPEQLMGEGVDHRSDIYSAGCILHELLTGKPPFVGGLAEVLTAHATEEPVAPSASRPDAAIPALLDEIVLICLRKRPDDRFASGANLLAALRGVPGFGARVSQSSARQRGTGLGPEYPGDETITSTLAMASRTPPRDTESFFGEMTLPTRPLPATAAFAAITQDIGLAATRTPPRLSIAALSDPAEFTSVEILRMDLRDALTELAEALLDSGAMGHRLTLAVVNARALADDSARNEAEQAHLEVKEATIEQHTREREGTLRFAIGELKFDRDRAGNEAARELDCEIAALEERLAALHHRAKKQLDEIVELRIGLTAAHDTLEQKLAQAFDELRQLVDRLIPQFDANLDIAPIMDHYLSIRDRLDGLTRAAP